MKTFTKKSLSIVLAVLMALSTLTIGGFSAFADQQIAVTPYADGISSSEEGTKYYSFTAGNSGYNAIMLQVAPTVAGASAYADFTLFEQTDSDYDDEDAYIFNGVKYESVSSSSSESTTAYSVGADKKLVSNRVYAPAYSTVKLETNKQYLVRVNNDANTLSKLTVARADFDVDFYENDEKLEYLDSENQLENGYFTTGYYAEIRTYYGSDTVLTVPASVCGIPTETVYLGFSNQNIRKRVTSVIIPEGVKAIGGMDNMYSLSSVSLPSTLERISSEAFCHDHSLGGRIVLGDKVEYVGDYAFYDTAISAVEVKNVETTIGSYAFGYKEVLNDVTPDPNDTTEAPVGGFMIISPAASFATRYAMNNGFAAYDSANCVIGNHPFALASTKAPTLFKKGSNSYYCPVCGATSKKATKKKTFAIKSVKSTKKGRMTVKVSKQSGISGYKIQYSTSKKFTKKTTKTVKVKTKKALSKTVKGLKSGKKYYVRVRAYKGKSNSAWTKVKAVKIK